jgi:hypothetical protein
MYLSKTIIIVCCVVFYLPAYATTTISSFPGISGIARMSSNMYLIVHDAKIYEQDKPRIGLLNIKSASGRIEYKQLDFPAAASALSSDLEGVCRVSNKSNEFLLAESGYWKKKYGRIFHIRVTEQHVVLVHEFQLPLLRDNNPDQHDGDQFEGIACVARNSDDVLILLGERGGTDVYPKGILRWGTYNLGTRNVIWSGQSQEVTAPNPWGASKIRSITGLSIDSKGQLWGSAAVDPGNDGPFRSVVYLIGHVDGNQKIPVRLYNPDTHWVVDGFKVEGVAAGEDGLPLSVGTEDENFGGVWRPLPELNSVPN